MRFTILRPDREPEIIDEKDMPRLYEEAWAAVDPSVKERAIAALRDALSDDDQQLIRDGIAKHGKHEWIHHDPFGHFGFGMAARNWLRRKGIMDAELPAFDAYYGKGTDVRNWDDFYVQALEAAVGARD